MAKDYLQNQTTSMETKYGFTLMTITEFEN
jgi:hypothetical protein